MNVGLPTTGIGGIFYLASAFMILLVELVLSLFNKSSIKRWKFVIKQNIFACLIIGALSATGIGVKTLYTLVYGVTSTQNTAHFISSYAAVTWSPILVAVVGLVIFEASCFVIAFVKSNK